MGLFDSVFSDPEQQAGVSGAMIGLGMGLLSQQRGENWGQALGRGIGQASTLQQRGKKDYRAKQQRERDDQFRAYAAEQLANNPGMTPDLKLLYQAAVTGQQTAIPQLAQGIGQIGAAQSMQQAGFGQQTSERVGGQDFSRAEKTRMFAHTDDAQRREIDARFKMQHEDFIGRTDLSNLSGGQAIDQITLSGEIRAGMQEQGFRNDEYMTDLRHGLRGLELDANIGRAYETEDLVGGLRQGRFEASADTAHQRRVAAMGVAANLGDDAAMRDLANTQALDISRAGLGEQRAVSDFGRSQVQDRSRDRMGRRATRERMDDAAGHQQDRDQYLWNKDIHLMDRGNAYNREQAQLDREDLAARAGQAQEYRMDVTRLNASIDMAMRAPQQQQELALRQVYIDQYNDPNSTDTTRRDAEMMLALPPAVMAQAAVAGRNSRHQMENARRARTDGMTDFMTRAEITNEFRARRTAEKRDYDEGQPGWQNKRTFELLMQLIAMGEEVPPEMEEFFDLEYGRDNIQRMIHNATIGAAYNGGGQAGGSMPGPIGVMAPPSSR